MAYLSFWHAFTYRKAMAKNTTVNKSIVKSCMAPTRNPGATLGKPTNAERAHTPPGILRSSTSLIAKPFDYRKGKIKKK